VFGNPPLGTLFLTSDPDAGLTGRSDCSSIRTRKEMCGSPTPISPGSCTGITNRDKEFKMASDVIASITSTVKPQ